MLDAPKTRVRAAFSPIARIFGVGLSHETVRFLHQVLSDFIDQFRTEPIEIEFQAAPPEHVGLGSKTALTLSMLTASARLTNAKVGREALQILSRRGGTSGVGVHGFFTGGLVVDAGHRGSRPLLPSSRQRPERPPTMTLAIRPKRRWVVSLPMGRRMSGQEEADFFARITPLPAGETLEQIVLAHQGLVPAFIESDLEEFGHLLDAFSTRGLKAREISNQGVQVAECMTALRAIAPCVGMSSMGPLVFAISHSELPATAQLPEGTVFLGRTVIADRGWATSDG